MGAASLTGRMVPTTPGDIWGSKRDYSGMEWLRMYFNQKWGEAAHVGQYFYRGWW